MIITYDQLLTNMQNAYFEKCGKKLDLNSECGARIQAVATELFSLACYGDFVLKQAFPQTATGDYLDNHAALRDITRKSASKAFGELTFSIGEASAEDITVPKDTVCCVGDNPYLQYATNEDAVLVAGELSVTVSATAIDEGRDFNVDAGAINTMVNPPSGITDVTNTQAFTGGNNKEYDIALRNRILSAYAVPPTGYSEQSLVDSIMNIDEVYDCKIYTPNRNIIQVCVRKDTSQSTSVVINNKIRDKLYVADLIGAIKYIQDATACRYDLVVEVYTQSGSNAQIDNEIRQVIDDITSSLRIGEDLKLSRIVSAVSGVAGVEYCEVSSQLATGNVILCPIGQYLEKTNLAVTYYE